MRINVSNGIHVYIKDMAEAIKESPVDSNSVIKDFQKLNILEKKFAKRLKTVAGGKQVYRDFVKHVTRTDETLNSASKYFRERESKNKEAINNSIRKVKTVRKENSIDGLLNLNVNFQFCHFAIINIRPNREGRIDEKLTKLYQEIGSIRENIIKAHLHYALHRAKAGSRNIKNILEFSDLVQIANQALILSVDKYVLDENASPFHMMLMGRMTAEIISAGDQNLAVSIGRKGSRELYKINRLTSKLPNLTPKEISVILELLETEVVSLIAASSEISLDETLGDSSGGDFTLKDVIPAPSANVYEKVESRDLILKSVEFFKQLTILEQKALRLKGIRFNGLFEGENDEY
jgi:hypothetical protein